MRARLTAAGQVTASCGPESYESVNGVIILLHLLTD